MVSGWLVACWFGFAGVNDVLSGRQGSALWPQYRVIVMYVIDVEDLSVQRAGHSGAQVFTIPGASESSRYHCGLLPTIVLWIAHVRDLTVQCRRGGRAGQRALCVCQSSAHLVLSARRILCVHVCVPAVECHRAAAMSLIAVSISVCVVPATGLLEQVCRADERVDLFVDEYAR
jgi:hypothetical protein